jgi:acid phosphatase family membrane protein YuiD
VENYSYLITVAIAWVLTQIIKSIVRTIERGKFEVNYLAESGGMPSVHAAFVVSFTTLAWLNEGWSSTLFALSGVLAVVVMYDAINVRYAVGKQAEALNALIKEKKSKVPPVEVIRGHHLVEVLVGAAIGATVAIVVFLTI